MFRPGQVAQLRFYILGNGHLPVFSHHSEKDYRICGPPDVVGTPALINPQSAWLMVRKMGIVVQQHLEKYRFPTHPRSKRTEQPTTIYLGTLEIVELSQVRLQS